VVKTKICGITTLADAVKAQEYGADMLGFIFVKGTPRCVDDLEAIAKESSEKLKKKVNRVGLFRNEKLEETSRIVSACDMDYVQLHGEESPEYCYQLKELVRRESGILLQVIKTLKVKDKIVTAEKFGLEEYRDSIDYFLFDTFDPIMPGGTGVSFKWEVLIEEKDRICHPFFIAGGLTPDNVAAAVLKVSPYGVDVSSGVEVFPGKKNKILMKEFIANAKKQRLT